MVAYHLIRNGEVLGSLEDEAPDFPWSVGVFRPTSAFESVRPAIEHARAVLKAGRWREEEEAWEAMRASGLCLKPVDPDDDLITDFVLHIDGDRFALRY